ncbi:MAG: hypothetical protein IJB97_11000 [Clostridia bacterium]|nr:hypothetical protein [Clostridia bacterium]
MNAYFITTEHLKNAFLTNVYSPRSYFLNAYLLSTGVRGALFAVLLFSIFFFCVHIAILAKRGWNANAPKNPVKKEKPPEKAEKNTEKPSEPKNQPEPVYFIVERKKKRAKSSYTEPKEIRFK